MRERTFYVMAGGHNRDVAVFKTGDGKLAKHVANSIGGKVIAGTVLRKGRGIFAVRMAERDVRGGIKRGWEHVVKKSVDEFENLAGAPGVDFILRDMPTELRRRIEQSAVGRGISTNGLILEILEKHV